MRAVVRRASSCGFALECAVDAFAVGILGRDARTSAVVMAVFELIHSARCDVLLALCSLTVAGGRVYSCVEVAANGLSGAL